VRLQKEIVHTMQGGKSYDHNAERLERNLSTEIHDVQIRALFAGMVAKVEDK
jgi:hypothetical protein